MKIGEREGKQLNEARYQSSFWSLLLVFCGATIGFGQGYGSYSIYGLTRFRQYSRRD